MKIHLWFFTVVFFVLGQPRRVSNVDFHCCLTRDLPYIASIVIYWRKVIVEIHLKWKDTCRVPSNCLKENNLLLLLLLFSKLLCYVKVALSRQFIILLQILFENVIVTNFKIIVLGHTGRLFPWCCLPIFEHVKAWTISLVSKKAIERNLKINYDWYISVGQ